MWFFRKKGSNRNFLFPTYFCPAKIVKPPRWSFKIQFMVIFCLRGSSLNEVPDFSRKRSALATFQSSDNCRLFSECKIRNSNPAQKNLFGFLKKLTPQDPIIFSDTPKPFGQINFEPNTIFTKCLIGFVWASNFYGHLAKKTTPQLYG